MIIRFETRRRKQDPAFKRSDRWAYEEAQEFATQELEDPDGNEVVGDRSYEGTLGRLLI